MNEIILTVGEFREMLELLPEEAELIFACQHSKAVMGFKRLFGKGEKKVQIDLATTKCNEATTYPHAVAS